MVVTKAGLGLKKVKVKFCPILFYSIHSIQVGILCQSLLEISSRYGYFSKESYLNSKKHLSAHRIK